MNIDFGTEPLFSAYTIVVMLTGVGTVVFAAAGMSGEALVTRFVATALGLGMFGYGAYLAFLFTGTDYSIYWQMFLAPVVLGAVVAKAIGDRREAALDAPPVAARRARTRRTVRPQL